MPETTKVCPATEICTTYKYEIVEEFPECPVACDTPATVQTRSVKCFAYKGEEKIGEVEDSFCEGADLEKPATERTCEATDVCGSCNIYFLTELMLTSSINQIPFTVIIY